MRITKEKTWPKMLSEGKEACSETACSPNDFECCPTSTQARPVIWGGHWPRDRACSNNDFERSDARAFSVLRALRRSKRQIRALIPSAQWLRSTPEKLLQEYNAKTLRLQTVFECCQRMELFQIADSNGKTRST